MSCFHFFRGNVLNFPVFPLFQIPQILVNIVIFSPFMQIDTKSILFFTFIDFYFIRNVLQLHSMFFKNKSEYNILELLPLIFTISWTVYIFIFCKNN